MLPFEEVKRKPEPLTESQVWGAVAPTPVELQCDGQCAYCKQPLLNAWRHADGSLICTHPELRPAAPAESQGVERAQPECVRAPVCPCMVSGSGYAYRHHTPDCPAAQPVEGPREKFITQPDTEAVKEMVPKWERAMDDVVHALTRCAAHFCQHERREHKDSCGCLHLYCECDTFIEPTAAPIEGVERVTDDAPAGVEPTCIHEWDHFGVCIKCDAEYMDPMPAAQPAKPTDDPNLKEEIPMKHEVIEDRNQPGDYRVEAIDATNDGEVFTAIFVGPDAQIRAEEYAQWKNK